MKLSHYILLALGIVLGWLIHRPETRTITQSTIDTLVVYEPKIDTIYNTEVVTTKIPLPPKCDTIMIHDTTYIEIPIKKERRIYQDSSYRAVISGAVVGDIHPTLEEISIRNWHTTETIHYQPRLFTPYGSISVGSNIFTLGGGVMVKQKYGIGLDLTNIQGQNYLTLRGILTF